MSTVNINGRVWVLGRRIGSGGFGDVWAANSEGHEAVVKFVRKDPGARRELLIADDVRGLPNVVPILDMGEVDDSWALVMPQADKSLRDHLAEIGPRLDSTRALPIMIDVAKALVGIANRRIVHRDLKPENILLLNGVWCLTDFGISRYSEATTAADTRKYSMSRPYAAPEQWREETATKATDVYAFGVLAFELVMGVRPFSGPDYRNQHLHQDPPDTHGTPAWLAELIEECLIKAAGARLAPERLLALLERQSAVAMPAAGGLAALQQASRATAAERAKEVRRTSQAVSESERRKALFIAAKRPFERIGGELQDSIIAVAPSASLGEPEVRGDPTCAWDLSLGPATLTLDVMREVKHSQARTNPDVIAWTYLAVTGAGNAANAYSHNNGFIGRAHSLWYCDALEPGQYHWFETAFRRTPPQGEMREGDSRMYNRRGNVTGIYIPFAVGSFQTEAVDALGEARTHQIAWPFTQLIPGELNEFIDRWASWFAASSLGRLEPPPR